MALPLSKIEHFSLEMIDFAGKRLSMAPSPLEMSSKLAKKRRV